MCHKTCIFFFFPIVNKYLCMAKRSLLYRCPSYFENERSRRCRVVVPVLSRGCFPCQYRNRYQQNLKGVTALTSTIEVWVLRSSRMLQTFRSNKSNPFARVEQSSWTACPLKVGPTWCPRNVSNQPTTIPRHPTSLKNEELQYTAAEAGNLKLNFHYVIKKTGGPG